MIRTRTETTPAVEQRRRIERLRKVLKPSPVQDRIPRWFTDRIKEQFGTPPGIPRPVPSTLVQWVRESFPPSTWCDHFGSTHWQGTKVFVSEPYPTVENLKVAIHVAWLLDIGLVISANSWWNPPLTIRLLFLPP